MEHQNPTLTDVDGNPITTRSLLAATVASDDAMVDFTSFVQSRFNRYVVEVDRLIPTVDEVNLYVRFAIAGDFKAGTGDYRWTVTDQRDTASLNNAQDSTATEIRVNRQAASASFGNNANEDFDLTFTLTNLGAASSLPRIGWVGIGHNDGGIGMKIDGMGQYIGVTSGATPSGGIDGLRFFFSSGLISAGTFRLYGQE